MFERKKNTIAAIICLVLGILIFFIGGFSPLFTKQIWHMFIFIGIAFVVFIISGILFLYSWQLNRRIKESNDTKVEVNYSRNISIYCPYCGSFIPENVEICPFCQSSL